MRVAVTGASGLVGSRLLRRLADAGHHGYGLDLPREAPRASEMLPAGWTYLGIDFRSGEGLDQVPWHSLDAVVHLAASGVSPATRIWEECVDINVGGTLRLLRSITAQKAKPAVIYTGTCYEMFLGQPAGVREDPYVLTKSMARQAVELWAQAQSSAAVLLTLFSVYGGRWGQGVLSYARQQWLQGQVVSLRSGRGLRDWIYLTDVVEALFRVVTMPRRGVESYDIGTGSACSVREAVETLARLMNVATDRIVCGTAKVQTMDELGFQGAQRLVPGWAPRFTLEDGLAEWIASQEGVG